MTVELVVFLQAAVGPDQLSTDLRHAVVEILDSVIRRVAAEPVEAFPQGRHLPARGDSTESGVFELVEVRGRVAEPAVGPETSGEEVAGQARLDRLELIGERLRVADQVVDRVQRTDHVPLFCERVAGKK